MRFEVGSIVIAKDVEDVDWHQARPVLIVCMDPIRILLFTTHPKPEMEAISFPVSPDHPHLKPNSHVACRKPRGCHLEDLGKVIDHASSEELEKVRNRVWFTGAISALERLAIVDAINAKLSNETKSDSTPSGR
jgi:hypothetical protein